MFLVLATAPSNLFHLCWCTPRHLWIFPRFTEVCCSGKWQKSARLALLFNSKRLWSCTRFFIVNFCARTSPAGCRRNECFHGVLFWFSHRMRNNLMSIMLYLYGPWYSCILLFFGLLDWGGTHVYLAVINPDGIHGLRSIYIQIRVEKFAISFVENEYISISQRVFEVRFSEQ